MRLLRWIGDLWCNLVHPPPRITPFEGFGSVQHVCGSTAFLGDKNVGRGRMDFKHIRGVLVVALLLGGAAWHAHRMATDPTCRRASRIDPKPLTASVRCSQEAGGVLLTNEGTETWTKVEIHVNASDVFDRGFTHKVASLSPGKLLIIPAYELNNIKGETMEHFQYSCRSVDVYAIVSGHRTYMNFVSE